MHAAPADWPKLKRGSGRRSGAEAVPVCFSTWPCQQVPTRSCAWSGACRCPSRSRRASWVWMTGLCARGAPTARSWWTWTAAACWTCCRTARPRRWRTGCEASRRSRWWPATAQPNTPAASGWGRRGRRKWQPAGVRPEDRRGTHLSGDPQGSMMEYPVREPCPPKCCYPDMPRSNPTCEASGTTASIWKHQFGSGPAEDGRLNACERPWLRSVIGNRPKVLTGRSQKGTRVGSSAASTDDGGTKTRRTIGRNLPIRLSTLDNRVSPIRPTVARRWYPDRKEGHDGGGRGTAEQAKAAL